MDINSKVAFSIVKPCKNVLHFFLLAVCLFFAYHNNAALADSQMDFLVFTDFHYKGEQLYPMVIFPSEYNDANTLDPTTFNTMFSQITLSSDIPTPNFILILGDLTGYEDNNISIYADINTVLNKVKASFPGIPIILVHGNNDSLSSDYSSTFDYGPFYSSQTPVYDTRSTYEIATQKLDQLWNDGFLSTGNICSAANPTYPCLINENTTYGYFDTYVAPNLRLIALNSIIFIDDKNNNAPQNVADQEIAWLTQELKNAAASNDYVLITSHSPSGVKLSEGNPFWRAADSAPFHQLLSDYKNIIIGVLFGHTHLEEFKILKNTTGNIVGAEISTPALITRHGNAPAIKSFHLNRPDGGQWSIANYTTFAFYPTPTSNSEGDFSLHKLYDFVNYYCPADLQNTQNIFQCLPYVTPDKMFANSYYQAGNTNYTPSGIDTNNIYITLPDPTPASPGSSHGVFGYIAAALASIAAAAAGIIHYSQH